MNELTPAARAFDAVAPAFDDRFGAWLSVAAQRRAVRRVLETAFPQGGRILEIGCGTGEDASWLTGRGFSVLATDASPAMTALTAAKLSGSAARSICVAAENLEAFAVEREQSNDRAIFDGAFSNFAALNCVTELPAVGRGLARLVRPGGAALLVFFGTRAPGDILVESLRGRFRQAFRRFDGGDVSAQLGGRRFTIRYHRRRAIAAAMAPWFRLKRCVGIGVFVPPSAAEPWISRHRLFLAALERLDRLAERPLAAFGDHVLYHFERTEDLLP